MSLPNYETQRSFDVEHSGFRIHCKMAKQLLCAGPWDLHDKEWLLIDHPPTVDYIEQFCAISKVPMDLIKDPTN